MNDKSHSASRKREDKLPPTPVDLGRERELVRSTGTISKRVMGLAFGSVLVIGGLGVAVLEGRWPQGLPLVVIGAVLLGWSFYDWSRRLHHPAGHRN